MPVCLKNFLQHLCLFTFFLGMTSTVAVAQTGWAWNAELIWPKTKTRAKPTPYFALPTGSIVSLDAPSVRRVDHSKLFSPQIAVQSAGTCHIYAATAFIEARCRQVTGKKYNLSESYFAYRHLREGLVGKGIWDLSQSGLLDQIQSGSELETVKRFLNGSYSLEQDFDLKPQELEGMVRKLSREAQRLTQKLQPEFNARLKKTVNEEKEWDNLNLKLQSQRNYYERFFNSQISEKFDDEVSCAFRDSSRAFSRDNVGWSYFPKIPNIESCIQRFGKFDYKWNPSQAEIVQQLDRGPVLCTGKYTFLSGSNIGGTALARGGSHSLILYGYREDLLTKRVEFLVRDSNSPKLDYYTVTGCDRTSEISEQP